MKRRPETPLHLASYLADSAILGSHATPPEVSRIKKHFTIYNGYYVLMRLHWIISLHLQDLAAGHRPFHSFAMRSFIAPLVLSFAIATSANEKCDLVSDVVQILHTVSYAPELCSTLLQISAATATSVVTETMTETRSIKTTETSTETETITDIETTITGTRTSTADAVSVTSTE